MSDSFSVEEDFAIDESEFIDSFVDSPQLKVPQNSSGDDDFLPEDDLNEDWDAIYESLERENNFDSQTQNVEREVPGGDNAPMEMAPRKKIIASVQEDPEEMENKREKMNRARQLRSMIKLEYRTLELFTLPPRTEYELYVSSFGSEAQIKQVSVQCPNIGELKEIGTKMDQKTMKHAVIQAPEDIALWTESTIHLHGMKKERNFQINSVGLQKFLQNCLPVVESLVDEMNNEDGKRAKEIQSNWKFSETYRSLLHGDITSHRQILSMSFAPSNRNEVAIAYSAPMAEGITKIHDKGLICIWHLGSLDLPSHILTCESEISCFSYSKPYIIVSGNRDGSVSLWDLRESQNEHQLVHLKGNTMYKRNPTYSTDWLLSENHISPIISIRATEGSQIITLDTTGTVIFWGTVELSEPEISEADFGLSIGGRVRLAKGGMMNIFGLEIDRKQEEELELEFEMGYRSRENNELQKFHALTVTSNTSEPGQYLFGIDNGTVLRRNRFHKAITPQTYNILDKETLSVNCIEYHPKFPSYFVTGSGNGMISIFHQEYSNPLYTFPAFTDHSIQRLCWQATNVLFALDSKSELFILDFLNPNKLIIQQNICRPTEKDNTIISAKSMSIFETSLAIGYSDGIVDVHTLKNLSSEQGDEKMLKYLDNLFA